MHFAPTPVAPVQAGERALDLDRSHQRALEVIATACYQVPARAGRRLALMPEHPRRRPWGVGAYGPGGHAMYGPRNGQSAKGDRKGHALSKP
jgi:hypothetical protein